MIGQSIPHSLPGGPSSVSGGSSDATIASSNTAAIQTSFANVFALLGHRPTDRPFIHPAAGYPSVCTSPTFESLLRHGGALHVLESPDILGQPLALLFRYRCLFVLQMDRKREKD